MKMRRLSRWLLLLTGLIVLALVSCDKKVPSKSPRDNPLDEHNPATGGDPFAVRAAWVAGGVRVTWEAVAMEGLAGYMVYRQVDDGEFVRFQPVEGAATTALVDSAVAAGHRYAYYVVARDPAGRESEGEWVRRAHCLWEPRLTIGDGGRYTDQHQVTLRLQAFGAQRLQVAADSTLAEAAWEDFQELREWTLTAGGGERWVYARVAAGGDTSGVGRAMVLITSRPVADAGEDQTVPVGAQVALRGSGRSSCLKR